MVRILSATTRSKPAWVLVLAALVCAVVGELGVLLLTRMQALVLVPAAVLVMGAVAVRSRARARDLAAVLEDLKSHVSMEHVSVVLWATDRQARFVMAAGKPLEKMGVPQGALVGKSVIEVCRDAPETLAMVRAALQGEPQSGESRLGDAYFETTIDPVRAADGTVVGLVGVSADVTERKRTEQKLAAARRRLDTILDEAPISMWTLDSEGRLTSSDGNIIRKLKYDQSQRIGKSVFELYRDDTWILDGVRAAMAGKVYLGEGNVRGLDIELHVVPNIGPDGELEGVTGLSIDISARKQAEKERAESLVREQAASEASRLKSEFLANMSHEIRTPMNGVIGMTELLLRMPLTEEARSYAETARNCGKSLLMLVNDILDLAKIEADKLQVEQRPFDLPKLIRESVDVIRFETARKQLSLTTALADSLPKTVVSDASRLRQVLTNLLSNALKFTQAGSIHVAASVLERSDARAKLKISVSDTGIGIATEAQERLFSPFQQADSSVTRIFGGTGLGLAISRRLAGLLGGELNFESKHGMGSTFWVTLEVELAQEELPVARPTFVPGEKSREGARVLVVEDNAVNQVVARRLLESAACCADSASNGHEAVQAAMSGDYDLILMDCQMPEMDGFEATSAIRRAEAALGSTQHVPIIALTANAMVGDRERCLASGMDDYLAKPIAPDALAAVLRKWLPQAAR